MLMLEQDDDLDAEMEIDEVEDLALELGPEAALEHCDELLQDIEDLIEHDRYDFELTELETERAELSRRASRLRVQVDGAPNQRAGELTLNQLARARGWSLKQAQEAFTRGEVVAHRWAVISGQHHPRFSHTETEG